MTLLARALTLFIALAVFFAGVGILKLTASRAPALAADAATYRADPACSAPISAAPVPAGACTFADGTILGIDFGNTGTRTVVGRGPHITIAVTGGPTASVDPADTGFVKSIAVGSAVRVQLFDNTIARIATPAATTDTTANPLYAEHASPIIKIVGFVMIAVGLFIGFRVFFPKRRRLR